MDTTATANLVPDEPPAPRPRRLDVSTLADSAMDAKAPLWWGNLLMILIETTTMALLVATYFYIRRNYEQWPPPQGTTLPPIAHPLPYLGAATANVVLLVLSCIPMYLVDQWARRKERTRVSAGLIFMGIVGIVSLALRWKELFSIHFYWNENAYASVVWTILVLHLIYVLAGVAEFLLMAAWIIRHGIDDKHALDVTLAGGYWYWTALVWVPVYFVIFWSPRWT
jgi:cytochrome c oxidase subunit III